MRTNDLSFPQDSTDITAASGGTAAAPADTGCVPVPDARFPAGVAEGIAVVTAPAEIDITNAEQLRSALLRAAAKEPATLVVDMSRTRFCDSAGLHTLVAAHRRARTEGRRLLLVISSAPVLRVLALTGIDRMIPNFTTLAEALDQPNVPANGHDRHRKEGDTRAEDQPVPPGLSR
jgi:anti-sigma B factor antagonist